jgi:hypothetical protein
MSKLGDYNEAMRAVAASVARTANTRPPAMPPLGPLVAALDDTIAALIAERRLEMVRSLAHRVQNASADVHTSLCGMSVDHARLLGELATIAAGLRKLEDNADAARPQKVA